MLNKKLKSFYKIFIKNIESEALKFDEFWIEKSENNILVFKLTDSSPIFIEEFPNEEYHCKEIDTDNRIDYDKKVILKEYLGKKDLYYYTNFMLLCLGINVLSKNKKRLHVSFLN